MRSVATLVSTLTLAQLAFPTSSAGRDIETVTLNDWKSIGPSEIALTFPLSQRLGLLTVRATRNVSDGQLNTLVLRLKSGERGSVPHALISCIPQVHYETIGIITADPNETDPAWRRKWPLIVSFSFGPRQIPSDQAVSVESVFPYIELRFAGLTFEDVVFHKSKEQQETVTNLADCPADTVSWSLSH